MASRSRPKSPPSPPVTVTELKTLLRSSGLRSTGARLAVLQYLHDIGGPNSHGELFDALADRGFDRATIYRNLMDLAEAGIVSRTDLGDHVWRFELKKGARGENHTEDHPHFVCVDCGSVACLPGWTCASPALAPAPRRSPAPSARTKWPSN